MQCFPSEPARYAPGGAIAIGHFSHIVNHELFNVSHLICSNP